MNNSGIYCITNVATGSCYIGSAVNIKRRWKSHRHTLRNKLKSPPKLQAAYDKYGSGSFKFSVLLLCAPEQLLYFEQRAISTLKPKYNTRLIAKSNLGLKWSESTNRKKSRGVTYEVRGVLGTVSYLAKYFGFVTKECARNRIALGWSVEDAVTTAPMSREDMGKLSAQIKKARGIKPARVKLLKFNGEIDSMVNMAAKYGVVSYYAVRARLYRGWDVEAALLTPGRQYE